MAIVKQKRTAYTPVTTNGVQGAVKSPLVDGVVKQAEEFVKENRPEPVEKFTPVRFIVIGSYQCPVPGFRSVSGAQENGFVFSATTKELVEWCEKLGFKKA